MCARFAAAEFGDIPTQTHLIYMAIDQILNLIKLTTTDPELLDMLEKLREKLKGDEDAPSKVKLDGFIQSHQVQRLASNPLDSL